GYGGGIDSIEKVKALSRIGIEKFLLNSAAIENPQLITEVANVVGSSSTVLVIDAKKKFSGYEVLSQSGSKRTGLNPIEWAKQAQSLGAGEIIIQSIDLEGTQQGYDLPLIRNLAADLNVPLVALGGAGKFSDFEDALSAGADATAAGTMFVLNG